MSAMSSLRRKQSNYKLILFQKRKENTERSLVIKFLSHVWKYLEEDLVSREIITYLIFCTKQDIKPSREYIIITMRMMQRTV